MGLFLFKAEVYKVEHLSIRFITFRWKIDCDQMGKRIPNGTKKGTVLLRNPLTVGRQILLTRQFSGY